MSICGPRPHALAHNELYRISIHTYMQRHHVKPGITGWAQIDGWRGETDTLSKMEKLCGVLICTTSTIGRLVLIRKIYTHYFAGFIDRNAY